MKNGFPQVGIGLKMDEKWFPHLGIDLKCMKNAFLKWGWAQNDEKWFPHVGKGSKMREKYRPQREKAFCMDEVCFPHLGTE